MKQIFCYINVVSILSLAILSCGTANATLDAVNFKYTAFIDKNPPIPQTCTLSLDQTKIDFGDVDPFNLINKDWKYTNQQMIKIELTQCNIESAASIPTITITGDTSPKNPYLFVDSANTAKGFGVFIFDSDEAKEGDPAVGGNEIKSTQKLPLEGVQIGDQIVGDFEVDLATAVGCGSENMCSTDNIDAGELTAGDISAKVTLAFNYP